MGGKATFRSLGQGAAHRRGPNTREILVSGVPARGLLRDGRWDITQEFWRSCRSGAWDGRTGNGPSCYAALSSRTASLHWPCWARSGWSDAYTGGRRKGVCQLVVTGGSWSMRKGELRYRDSGAEVAVVPSTRTELTTRSTCPDTYSSTQCPSSLTLARIPSRQPACHATPQLTARSCAISSDSA